jgi:hypothetical protein
MTMRGNNISMGCGKTCQTFVQQGVNIVDEFFYGIVFV